MWSIIEPKGRGSNETPPFPMSSNTLWRRKPYLFLLEFKEWAEACGKRNRTSQHRSEEPLCGEVGLQTAWKAGYTGRALSALTGDIRRTDAEQWWDVCQGSTVIGGSGRLLGSLCEPRKETTDRKWNIPGILLTSLNQLKVRNVSEHISDRSLADMDSSFSPGSRSGRNRGQSEKEQMSHLPLVQGKEHGSCPHSYLLPP